MASKKNKRLYVLLWILCLLGACSVLPYIHYLGILPLSFSLLKLFLLGTTQAALLYGLICILSYNFLPKTDLKPFAIKKVPQ